MDSIMERSGRTRRGFGTAVAGLACLGLLAPRLRAEDWPQFRGAARDNVSKEMGLLRKWPQGGPKVLWTIPVGQGYAGAAIAGGRVYHNDYDEAKGEWGVICRSLATGKEIWRYAEPKRIRPNHAITRTVPAVDARQVFSMDPKCNLYALDARTGKKMWQKDLVAVYKTRIPPWYNGQNPLIEADRVVVATGGDAVLVALDKATGKELWRTANSINAILSHVSVMPATLGGVKQYLYATLESVMGVSAKDGKLLWNYPRKFNVAAAPSPLAVDAQQVFVTGPYDAGSTLIKVSSAGGAFKTDTSFDMKNNEWNSEVHTPIVYKGHFFAVGKKRRGLFTCLDFNGNKVWDSDGKAAFELGSFLLADGMFYILEGKTGMLRLIEANTTGYKELDKAQVLSGEDVWGPMALSDGKLVLRDLTKMVCIDVRGK
ncbi:MAG: PQQ-like beta-propeller repeat protein [Candidatus Solibacter usitatus]|nr:PQQ-like beta-propeller repeat protein [Candidatus Solibacter usitatus]